MKNRFVGLITVTFPDDYVEECIVKERESKGDRHFMQQVVEYTQLILKQVPEGHVNVKYRGDLAREIDDMLQEVKG